MNVNRRRTRAPVTPSAPSGAGELPALLEREQIPATLFLSGRWLAANPAAAAGAADTLPELRRRGVRFVSLEEFPLR